MMVGTFAESLVWVIALYRSVKSSGLFAGSASCNQHVAFTSGAQMAHPLAHALQEATHQQVTHREIHRHLEKHILTSLSKRHHIVQL